MREGHEKSFSTFFFYSASWEKANFLSLEGEWLFAVARRQDHLTLFEEFWIKLHFSLSFTTLFSPPRRRGFFLKCRLSSGDTKSRVAFPSHEFRGTVVNKENHFPSVLRVSHQVRDWISSRSKHNKEDNATMASPSGKMLSLSGCSADGVNNHSSEDEATDTHKDISHKKP